MECFFAVEIFRVPGAEVQADDGVRRRVGVGTLWRYYMYGFVLPSTKFDGNPLLYKQIKNMKRKISLRYRSEHPANGATFGVKRATSIGASSVSLLLSHFQVYDQVSFLRLPRRHRHHLVVSMMQHTCGMRFGYFMWRNYRVSAFTKDLHGPSG